MKLYIFVMTTLLVAACGKKSSSEGSNLLEIGDDAQAHLMPINAVFKLKKEFVLEAGSVASELILRSNSEESRALYFAEPNDSQRRIVAANSTFVLEARENTYDFKRSCSGNRNYEQFNGMNPSRYSSLFCLKHKTSLFRMIFDLSHSGGLGSEMPKVKHLKEFFEIVSQPADVIIED